MPALECSNCKTQTQDSSLHGHHLCSCRHASYKCYFFINGDEYLRNKILDEINSTGIPCFSGSCSEIYREKAFDGAVSRPDKPLSVAERLGKTSLMFLCDQTISEQNVEKMCNAIDLVGQRYSRYSTHYSDA